MVSRAGIQPVEGLVDAVANILCSAELENVEELGVFYALTPDPPARTVSAAIVMADNRLGVATWALPALYADGKRRLQASRADWRAASAILVAVPDFASAWAVRKARMCAEGVSLELAFAALILRRSPKSAETWSHRAWVLRRFGWTAERATVELGLARVAASMAASNYYAGVQRLRAVPHAPKDVLVQELAQNRMWLHKHVGDSSGWWYHRILLDRMSLLQSCDDREESFFVKDMALRYKATHECVRKHETWFSRKIQASWIP